MDEPRLVTVLKALADPMRLEMLSHFKDGGTVACGDILSACPRSQPTVSHHLGKLAEAGILLERKSGTQKSYELDAASLASLGIDLPTLVTNLPVRSHHGPAEDR